MHLFTPGPKARLFQENCRKWPDGKTKRAARAIERIARYGEGHYKPPDCGLCEQSPGSMPAVSQSPGCTNAGRQQTTEESKVGARTRVRTMNRGLSRLMVAATARSSGLAMISRKGNSGVCQEGND